MRELQQPVPSRERRQGEVCYGGDCTKWYSGDTGAEAQKTRKELLRQLLRSALVPSKASDSRYSQYESHSRDHIYLADAYL